MRKSFGWAASLALLASLVSAFLGWQAKTVWFFAPLVLFAVAAVLGFVAWRTWAGKVAALGGLGGLVLWVGRVVVVIDHELGTIWRNG